jgi:iron complex outermembrane receptor protein
MLTFAPSQAGNSKSGAFHFSTDARNSGYACTPAAADKRELRRRLVCLAPTLLCCGIFVAGAWAQTAAPAPTDAQKPTETTPQKPARVTTTVVVHGEVKDDYLSDSLSAGSLDGTLLKDTPLALSSVSGAVMSDQVSRVLSDVVKNDASVGEDYAPVGYYGDFTIRAFPIDLATGLQINGMTVAGEQDVPLENKERVEIVKGIAGIESGVASAGGLINFVTKAPAFVQSIDLATDHRGTAYSAVDLGRLLGSRKQVGMRLNLAGERIATYVNDANGWRAVGAGSADWKLNSRAALKGDFEFQHKVERSVSGYQLLGGTTVPDLHRISPATMLGEQSWSKPNTFDVSNSSVRLDYDLPRAWRSFASASYSHSLIDDNVVYAYGCYYEDACNVLAGPAPWFFAPDGTYDIYDYRNPGELRINAQAEALVIGHIKTGPLSHDIVGGGSIFRRSVQQPSLAVFDYVGSENIFEPNQPVPIESIDGAPDKAGPRVLYEDNHQPAAVLQDRIHIPGRIQLLAGGKLDWLRDHNFSGTTPDGVSPIITHKTIWLPQYAITFNPLNDLTLYGNYGVLLSLGPQAPFWAGGFYLEPYLTRQSEIGAKYEPGQRILFTAALFHMRAPFFYPKTIDEQGDQNFVSQGHETHDGFELNAQGKLARWMQLNASVTALRAKSSNTGTPAFDDKQVLNVPHLRTAVFADVLLPHARGLHLMPGWSYTGRKEATRDGLVSVPGYNLFNLGARYMPRGEQGHVALRIYADNIFDKRYWKDTGASYGDTFIHLGAPTTVRLSAHYTF